jgi:hypothetical protein
VTLHIIIETVNLYDALFRIFYHHGIITRGREISKECAVKWDRDGFGPSLEDLLYTRCSSYLRRTLAIILD